MFNLITGTVFRLLTFLGSACLSTVGASVVVPLYEVADSRIHITHTAATRGSAADFFFATRLDPDPARYSRAVGRSSHLLDHNELDNLGIVLPSRFEYSASVEPDGMFVLWKIGEESARITDTGVAIAFDLASVTTKTAYLGIGADHRYVVMLNGKAISARAGYDYHAVCSNVVALPLRPGVNRIIILAACMQIPAAARYFSPPWELSLFVFGQKSQAVAFHDLKNRHCLDTPIACSADEIRCSVGSPIYRYARFLDINGTEIADGEVREDGAIKWIKSVPSDVQFGRIEIDDCRGEPVLLVAETEIDGLVERNNNLSALLAHDDPWAIRVRHLLKSEFRPLRTTESRWARKFTAAFHRAAFKDSRGTGAPITRSTTGFEFKSYFSKIDGTRQHYGYYFPLKEMPGPTRSVPVVVVLPAVQTPIRPFLESPLLAGTEQIEQWCSVADETSVALVWPGYVDVDYGGAITQTELKEILQDFYHEHLNAGSLELLGMCSSAVTALQFIKENPGMVDGVMLHSPVLSKRTRRFTPGIWGQPVPNPFSPLSTYQLAGDFKVQRCALLFDLGIPGHGEPSILPNLVELAKTMHVPLTQFETESSEEYLWGERMNRRMYRFFDWVGQTNSITTPKIRGAQFYSGSEVRSVQQALLSGFDIRAQDTLLANDWLNWWMSQYVQWRGSLIRPSENSRVGARPLTLKIMPAETLLTLASAEARREIEPTQNKFFAVYLENRFQDIIVARTTQAESPLPKVDIMLDGNFRSALWSQDDDGKWKLTSINY